MVQALLEQIPRAVSALWKQQRFFVDNLMLSIQLADVSSRCSSHPRGKSEARCNNDGNFMGVAPGLAGPGPVQRSVH